MSSSLTGITVSLIKPHKRARYLSDSSERKRLHSSISWGEILLVSEIVQHLISPYVITLLSVEVLMIKEIVS